MPRNGAYDEFGERLSRSDVAEIERFEADETRWFREWERQNPVEAAANSAHNSAVLARVDEQRARLYGTAPLSGAMAQIKETDDA